MSLLLGSAKLFTTFGVLGLAEKSTLRPPLLLSYGKPPPLPPPLVKCVIKPNFGFYRSCPINSIPILCYLFSCQHSSWPWNCGIEHVVYEPVILTVCLLLPLLNLLVQRCKRCLLLDHLKQGWQKVENSFPNSIFIEESSNPQPC